MHAEPNPKQWTPESRAAFCAASGFTEADLDAYAAMHEAWQGVEFTRPDIFRPSQERRDRHQRAWATFRAKRARWTKALRARFAR